MQKKVYMAMSADVLHQGHINVINEATKLGELTVGILTDEVIATYKRYPVLDYNARKKIISSIKGVSHVIPQTELSYEKNLALLKPDYVVHGDDWTKGIQSKVRRQVIKQLKNWNGELVEVPYTEDASINKVNKVMNQIGLMPEVRRARLESLLNLKPIIRAMEAHNGLSGYFHNFIDCIKS